MNKERMEQIAQEELENFEKEFLKKPNQYQAISDHDLDKIQDGLSEIAHGKKMARMHQLYGVIAFVCMVTGIVLAVREWSLWSFAYVLGAVITSVLLQSVVGILMKDPRLKNNPP